MKMASDTITRITSSLGHLQSLRGDVFYNRLIRIVMHKLRSLRTFVLCSRKLGASEIEGTNLGALFLRIGDVIGRILDDLVPQVESCLAGIDSFEVEMDKWYISLSLQSSPSVDPNQVEDIFDSIVENLEDFLSLHRAYVGVVVEPVEALKELIIFFKSFIHFAALLCTQHQDYQELFTRMEALAITAAHLTVHLFSATHYNVDVFYDNVNNSNRNLSYDALMSMVSVLLLKFEPISNPHLYETYARALESLISSRDLYVPALNINEFLDFLLSTLWEMLQFDRGCKVHFRDKLQVVYEGLRSFGTMLKKYPTKFVGKMKDITGAAVFDAGILIFSLQQKDFGIDHGLEEFLEKMKVIRTEVHGEQAVDALDFGFPETNVLGFLDFLLDYLTEFQGSKVDSDILSFTLKIQEYLCFLKSFMRKLVDLRNKQKDLHQARWNLAVEVAYKMEFLIDQMVLENSLDSLSVSLLSIAKDMMIIETDSMTFEEERQEIEVQDISWTSADQLPSPLSTMAVDEVVGFEAERSSLINRLSRGPRKLQVVTVVGMPGSGKTTLATKVYNEPSVVYHFHVRAWCSISQVFNKRKVLIELLNQTLTMLPDGYYEMSDDDLAQQLWRSLKRRKYLIFMDDVWDIQTFDHLKGFLPDDSAGSRILLTSRHCDVVIHDEEPLLLRQLTDDECLELLQRKLFPGNDWPSFWYESMMDIIAENCKGLPLTVVIAAGLLKTTKQEVWTEVLESLWSGIISTTNQCMNTIELSYKHLPDHLKSCFLSFGAIPEDQSVSVKMLIWLWIAEGFVQKCESKSLEEVATDYLKNLIGRSLVMNAEERSMGGVKACRIHDLLRDFCLRKANEEKFSHTLKGYDELMSFNEPGNWRRLSIHSELQDFKKSRLFCPRLRSLSLFDPSKQFEMIDVSFIFRIFKLLRVLIIAENSTLPVFPSEVGFLVQLRFLEIQATLDISPSIGKLSNLEILILYGARGIIQLPETFWNLQKLRHLFLSHVSHFDCIELPLDNLDRSYNLLELDSLSTLYCHNWNIMIKKLRKFPNIRALKCTLMDCRDDKVMSISFLSHLESLHLSFRENSTEFDFNLPETIKKLTLANCGLPWSKISSIAKLPNLKVLKLLVGSFLGNTWHVEEGEFSELIYLKFDCLFFCKWTACDDQFHNLKKLVFYNCSYLKKIPKCLKNVATLEKIQVTYCCSHLARSVKKVEDFQKEMGNKALQVHVRSTR